MHARTLLLGSALAIGVLGTTNASAYNWRTHQQLSFIAVGAMTDPATTTAAPPPGVDPAEWAAYLAATVAAPGKLVRLRTGLPSALQSEVLSPLPYVGAGGENFPFERTTSVHNTSRNCQLIEPRQFNLDVVGSMRIADLVGYEVQRSVSNCGLTLASKPENTLPSVLGWMGASVDDHSGEGVFWFRPTNSGVIGVAKEIVSRAAGIAVGAIVAPFKCLYDAIFGDGCDADSFQEGYDLGKKINPVEYAEGWIPGFGDYRDGDTPTVWHFQHVGGANTRYNDERGLFYENAGPSYPGIEDVAAMVGADLLGISLNAASSSGDDIYGQYDKVGRTLPQWQAHTIAHTEFSPLDHMARYGWEKFQAEGGSSVGPLAWPLHAVGDACAPHHIAGTSGWGHRRYENYVEDFAGVFLVVGEDAAQRARVLSEGFRWWKLLRDTNDASALVKTLAADNHAAIVGANNWPYELVLSGSTLDNHLPEMQALVDRGGAATLAVLVRASELSHEPPTDPATLCAPGTAYQIGKGGCVAGPPAPVGSSSGPLVCSTGMSCGGGSGGAAGTGGSGSGSGGSGSCVACFSPTWCTTVLGIDSPCVEGCCLGAE